MTPTIEIQWTGHKFYNEATDQWFKILSRDAYCTQAQEEVIAYISELTGVIYTCQRAVWTKDEKERQDQSHLQFFHANRLAERSEKGLPTGNI